MRYAIIEEGAAGQINRILSTTDTYIEVPDDVSDDTHFFNQDIGAVEPKATPEVTASVDGLVVTLTGVPVGAAISVNGISDTADAETFEIELEAPGRYQIRVFGMPAYRERSLTVEV